MDPTEKPKREIIVKAGRFRSQTVFAPLDWLHPSDMKEAVEAMRDLGAGLPPLTICTRNPYVLDEFPAEQCFVVGPSGKIKRLLDHPQAKEHLGSLSTGEFWSTVGEAWVDAEEKP
jgi:hypothetical protein